MSGHDQPEQAVTFKRNGRSRWAGICNLAVYSLGLAIPFLATSLFIEHFRARVRWMSRWSQSLRIFAGLVLILMGVMVLTGQMTRFASWMLSTFPILGRLG